MMNWSGVLIFLIWAAFWLGVLVIMVRYLR